MLTALVKPMKILALSDEVVDAIDSMQVRDLYGDAGLVVGCGDLPYHYLEFVVSVLPVPLVYVHGNHDRSTFMADGTVSREPGGCILLEDRLITAAGLALVGLGGSILYNQESPYQYTDAEMRWRITKLLPQLLFNRIRTGRYLDVLVAHSPPMGIHDGEDRAHRGFPSFLSFLRRFKPKLLLHGHTFPYRQTPKNATRYHDTTVMNVFPARVIDWPPHE